MFASTYIYLYEYIRLYAYMYVYIYIQWNLYIRLFLVTNISRHESSPEEIFVPRYDEILYIRMNNFSKIPADYRRFSAVCHFSKSKFPQTLANSHKLPSQIHTESGMFPTKIPQISEIVINKLKCTVQ